MKTIERTVLEMGGIVSHEPRDYGPRVVVFAVDPGITTGWSAMSVPCGTLRRQGVVRTLARSGWRHGTILRAGAGIPDRSDPAHMDEILRIGRAIHEEWVSEDDEFAFVMEGFQLRMMSMDKNLLAPVRLLAIWEDRLRGAGVSTFVQQPSDAKAVVTDDRLRRWCMYEASSGVHARDADRHAILFVRRFADNIVLRKSLFLAVDEDGWPKDPTKLVV